MGTFPRLVGAPSSHNLLNFFGSPGAWHRDGGRQNSTSQWEAWQVAAPKDYAWDTIVAIDGREHTGAGEVMLAHKREM
jgi:hypothetical protein